MFVIHLVKMCNGQKNDVKNIGWRMKEKRVKETRHWHKQTVNTSIEQVVINAHTRQSVSGL